MEDTPYDSELEDDSDCLCLRGDPPKQSGLPEPTREIISPCGGDEDEDDLLVFPEPLVPRRRSSPTRSRARGSGARRGGGGGRACTTLQVRVPTPEPRYDPPDTNRMDALFECARRIEERTTRVRERIRALAHNFDPAVVDAIVETLDQIPPDAHAMARQASSICEGSAVEVSLMRQALAEESVDLDVRAVRVLERQRAMQDGARDGESQIIAKSIAAAQRVEQSMATLHPHESFARPAAAFVNGPMLALSRRADNRG